MLSYAYLFASYLVAATGFALGMSRIADMRRGALADWREVIADTVPAGFRYSMLLVAPALAALIAGGATLIGEVLPKSFSAADVSQLRIFSALLAAWTVAALLVNLLLPALFALGRSKLVNLLAPVIVVLHIAVTALGGVLFGAEGVVGAFFVVPLAFAAVLLFAGAGRESGPIAPELAKDGLRFALLAAVSFGIGAAIGDTFTSGIATPLLTLAIGSLLYVSLGFRLAGRSAAAAARRRTTRIGMNVAVRSGTAGESWGERLGVQTRRIATNADARAIAGLAPVLRPARRPSAGAPGASPRSTPATSSTSPTTLASGGQPVQRHPLLLRPGRPLRTRRRLRRLRHQLHHRLRLRPAAGRGDHRRLLRACPAAAAASPPPSIATAIVAAIGFSGTAFNFVLPHTNSATFGILFLLLMLLALKRERLVFAGLAAGVVWPDPARSSSPSPRLAGAAYLVGLGTPTRSARRHSGRSCRLPCRRSSSPAACWPCWRAASAPSVSSPRTSGRSTSSASPASTRSTPGRRWISKASPRRSPGPASTAPCSPL